MVEGEVVNSLNDLVPMPLGDGREEPAENREEDRPLYVEAELSARKKTMKNCIDPQLLPEPLEDETWSYLLRLGMKVALSGQHEEHALREAGEGATKCLDLTPGPEPIPPSSCRDDTLDELLVLPAVLDDLEVFVGTSLFDSREHGCP
jgi:hypothetical protein